MTEILNKVTNNKPHIVVLPENAREEALQLRKTKMTERTLSFSAEVGNAISRIPKDFAQWWDQDSDDPETRGMAMLAFLHLRHMGEREIWRRRSRDRANAPHK